MTELAGGPTETGVWLQTPYVQLLGRYGSNCAEPEAHEVLKSLLEKVQNDKYKSDTKMNIDLQREISYKNCKFQIVDKYHTHHKIQKNNIFINLLPGVTL